MENNIINCSFNVRNDLITKLMCLNRTGAKKQDKFGNPLYFNSINRTISYNYRQPTLNK